MLRIVVNLTDREEPVEIRESSRVKPLALGNLFREIRARAGEEPGRGSIHCYANDTDLVEIAPANVTDARLLDGDEDISAEALP